MMMVMMMMMMMDHDAKDYLILHTTSVYVSIYVSIRLSPEVPCHDETPH